MKTKKKQTPKLNKWKDPFYREAMKKKLPHGIFRKILAKKKGV